MREQGLKEENKASNYLVVDGSQGEGGGQVLRTALTLAIVTQQNIELINIRAGRKKTGLLRQHLTCVLAAKKVCGATVENAELGASWIRFSPGKVKAGDFHFAIGTAGSTVLVCQTILPVLALADKSSTVTFEGGTHNGMSPSLSFLQQSYLPILKSMGVSCEVHISSLGFYPAGGGKWQLKIDPVKSLLPFHLSEAGSDYAQDSANCALKVFLSALPESIALREVASARSALNWLLATSDIEKVVTPGAGNSLLLIINSKTHHNIFEQVGEVGVSAAKVAQRAAGRVQKFVDANAAVEEYLADQLLLLMALAGGGSFTTTEPSLHTRTNIAVIQQVLGKEIQLTALTETLWSVALE